MGRFALAAGAVLIVGGGAALGFALTRSAPAIAEMTPEQTRAMAGAIERLDGEIKEAHSNAKVRATTFVESRRELAVGLSSRDQDTVADQVYGEKGGEAKLTLAPGELLEIGYVDGTGWKRLVSQPKDAPESGFGGKPASYAKLVDDRLMVYEVVEVKLDGKPVGYATLGKPKELKAVFDQLAGAGITGRFELGAAKREIGGALPIEVTTLAMPLREPNARIVVAAPEPVGGGKPMALIGGGAGASALGLVLLLVGLITGKQRQAATADDLPASASQASGPDRPTQLTAPQAIAPAAAAMIGRWEVIRLLGSGGMADVYLARSKGEAGFEKLVAIKVMHAHLARNERAVEQFLAEARLAARISHPNVVQILDLGRIGNDYVIVMEYVEGVDLERLLASARTANRAVPIDVGLGILCRICDGLHAAHTAVGADGTPLGIIHRDVKCANVLVSRQGGVKVVDFGIAKAAAQASLTAAGETKGTLSVMAPEQRIGERVDVRADVYAVAAVGFELLTGHGVNLDLAELAHLGIDNWPHLPPPSSLRPQLPEELDAILLGAMAFERDQRPESCMAFEAMFEQVMKQYGLGVSDKDLARWVGGELRHLLSAFESDLAPAGDPAPPSS